MPPITSVTSVTSVSTLFLSEFVDVGREKVCEQLVRVRQRDVLEAHLHVARRIPKGLAI